MGVVAGRRPEVTRIAGGGPPVHGDLGTARRVRESRHVAQQSMGQSASATPSARPIDHAARPSPSMRRSRRSLSRSGSGWLLSGWAAILGEERLTLAATMDALHEVGAELLVGEHLELLGCLVARQRPQLQGGDSRQPPVSGDTTRRRRCGWLGPEPARSLASRRLLAESVDVRPGSRVAESAQCRSSINSASGRNEASEVRVASTAQNSRCRAHSSSGSDGS